MSKFVASSVDGPVATVTIDRPERHNSLVPELLADLRDALNRVDAADDVRVAVLHSTGDSFSTGGDVASFYEHREDLTAYAERTVGGLNEVIVGLLELSVPVVAAVDGQVTGGSLGLLLGSDIVLLSPEATVTPYYCVVGFSPDGGWTAILPDLIGPSRVVELLTTNGTIRPAQAVDWGIANRVVDDGDVTEAASETAETIAGHKPGSISRAKRLLRGDIQAIRARLANERNEFVAQITTEEARVGMAAFVEGDS